AQHLVAGQPEPAAGAGGGAAEPVGLLDHHHPQAVVRRGERGGHPGGAAAHHHHVELGPARQRPVRCHGASRAFILEHVTVSAGRTTAGIRRRPVPPTAVPPTAVPPTAVPQTWDIQADVVVVGFGAAGACAALEATAAGRDVVVLDRFAGGGATALSGGVIYAGGGTPHQLAAGVRDSPEAMVGYLSLEVGDAVSPATLREFCRGSRDMLAWLERHGVPFEGSLCPDKTSYPTNRHYLYYSGSELSAAASAGAGPPAPRGHRTKGRGTSGGLLYARLAVAVRAAGVRVLTQTTARELVTDPAGRVTGVACTSLRGAPGWARLAHRVLHRWSVKPYLYVPKAGRVLHRAVAWLERRYGRAA